MLNKSLHSFMLKLDVKQLNVISLEATTCVLWQNKDQFCDEEKWWEKFWTINCKMMWEDVSEKVREKEKNRDRNTDIKREKEA